MYEEEEEKITFFWLMKINIIYIQYILLMYLFILFYIFSSYLLFYSKQYLNIILVVITWENAVRS